MKKLVTILLVFASFSSMASTFCGKVIRVDSEVGAKGLSVSFEMDEVSEVNDSLKDYEVGYIFNGYKKTISGDGVEHYQRSLLKALGDSQITACHDSEKISLRSRH